ARAATHATTSTSCAAAGVPTSTLCATTPTRTAATPAWSSTRASRSRGATASRWWRVQAGSSTRGSRRNGRGICRRGREARAPAALAFQAPFTAIPLRQGKEQGIYEFSGGFGVFGIISRCDFQKRWRSEQATHLPGQGILLL